MKITSGLLSLLLIVNISYGQNFSDASVSLNPSIPSLKKNDVQILDLANYIMSHPIDSMDSIRNNAMGTVLLWIMSTPDYEFFIDETIVPLIKNNEEVLAIFMVSMVQCVLENPYMAKNKDELKFQAYSRLLDYYSKPVNKTSISKPIEQAIYAMRVGRLRKYLRIY